MTYYNSYKEVEWVKWSQYFRVLNLLTHHHHVDIRRNLIRRMLIVENINIQRIIDQIFELFHFLPNRNFFSAVPFIRVVKNISNLVWILIFFVDLTKHNQSPWYVSMISLKVVKYNSCGSVNILWNHLTL